MNFLKKKVQSKKRKRKFNQRKKGWKIRIGPLMITAVVGVISDNGRILIGKKQEKDSPLLSGKWHIPGGKVDLGESPEEALAREMKEETGIDIKIKRLIGEHIVKDKHGTDLRVIWFECSPTSGSSKGDSDLVEIKWVNKKEAINLLDEEAVDLFPKEVQEYFRE